MTSDLLTNDLMRFFGSASFLLGVAKVSIEIPIKKRLNTIYGPCNIAVPPKNVIYPSIDYINHNYPVLWRKYSFI
jgi:hypothetical protein